jgi:peptidoglycan/LPS O-acetylase OafA/YrhL
MTGRSAEMASEAAGRVVSVPDSETFSIAAAHRAHDNNFNLIRLFAASQVLIVHCLNHFGVTAPWVSALKILPGVPVFFFISGYLIYKSYHRTRERGKTAFFVNRVLRIYPALVVCVFVSVLSVYLTGYFDRISFDPIHFAAWLLGQTTVVQFYNPDFMREYGAGVLNGALWTISVEVQFYVLVPVLYWLSIRARGVFVAVFAISLLVNLWQRTDVNWELLAVKLLYVSFIPWVYMFLLGFIAASSSRLRDWIQRIDLWVFVGLFVISMVFVGEYSVNASNAINPFSFAMLGAIILKVAYARMRIWPGLARFFSRNDFSYGLYLYHMPLINLMLFTAVVPAVSMVSVVVMSALAAAISWYFVERPALSHKR